MSKITGLVNRLIRTIGVMAGLLFNRPRLKKLTGSICGLLRNGYLSVPFKSIGKSITIQKHVKLLGEKYITVGEGTSIGSYTILTAWDRFNCIVPETGGVILNTLSL